MGLFFGVFLDEFEHPAEEFESSEFLQNVNILQPGVKTVFEYVEFDCHAHRSGWNSINLDYI